MIDGDEEPSARGRTTLTKAVVEALMPGPRDRHVWDAKLPGFGVKVTPKGKRVYRVKYWLAGRAGWYTIGTHGVITAEEARREARRIKGEVAAGRDPQAAKRAARAELEEERQPPGPANVVDTFDKVLDEFIQRDQRPRCATWRETDRRLRNHVLPHWRGRDIRSITRKDALRLMDGLRDAGLAGGANRVLSALRRLFSWAVDREIVEASPVASVKPPAAEIERERVLTDPEVRAVWRGAQALGAPFGPFVRLLLVTAQRRSEVARMRWSDVDARASLWRIPASETKADRSHDVPLPQLALDALAELGPPPAAGAESGPAGRAGFVFSTTGGKRPISGFSKAKRRLDDELVKLEASGAVEVVPNEWRLHDLRRTAATGMARAGVPVFTISRVLNHAEGGVTRLYDRHSYLEEKRVALNTWAELLNRLVASAASDFADAKGEGITTAAGGSGLENGAAGADTPARA